MSGGEEFSDEDFEACFKEFDKDGSGTIEKDEMAIFIKKVAGLWNKDSTCWKWRQYDFKAYSSTQPTSLMQHQPIPAVKESKVWRDKDFILTSDCEVKFKRFSHALKL